MHLRAHNLNNDQSIKLQGTLNVTYYIFYIIFCILVILFTDLYYFILILIFLRDCTKKSIESSLVRVKVNRRGFR